MKKIIIIFAILCINGCSQNLKINEPIKEIQYNNTTILKKDYNDIINNINTKYKNTHKNIKYKNKLTIKTNKNIYYFGITKNGIVYKNTFATNKNIKKNLDTLKNKYQNKNIYTIKYKKNIPQNKDTTINLDKTSNYIIINTKKQIKNFRINEIDKESKEINLIYTNKNFQKNHQIVIRKSINYNYPDIKISFENKYGYTISIIPTYDANKNKIKFNRVERNN